MVGRTANGFAVVSVTACRLTGKSGGGARLSADRGRCVDPVVVSCGGFAVCIVDSLNSCMSHRSTGVVTDVNQIQIYSLETQGLQGLGTGSSSDVARYLNLCSLARRVHVDHEFMVFNS